MLSDDGLSILIPVYNYDVLPLASQLSQYAQQLNYLIEIRVYDDGSSESWRSRYAPLQTLPLVVFKTIEKNIGRAAIRALLLKDALYPFALLLDADMQPVHPDYLKTYVTLLPCNAAYGGIVYSEKKPEDNAFLLHWKMGRYREMRSAQKRALQPEIGGSMNNLLIKKKIALTIETPDLPYAYGYEDALFVDSLIHKGIQLIQIENPILHLGLTKRETMLEKTKQAMYNAAYAYKQWRKLDSIPVHKAYRLGKAFLGKFLLNVILTVVFAPAQMLALRFAWLWCVDLCKLYWYTKACTLYHKK